jgi:hypothetical protein
MAFTANLPDGRQGYQGTKAAIAWQLLIYRKGIKTERVCIAIAWQTSYT